jgi:hypothetical protein
MAITVSILQKKFSRSVDPKQPSSFHVDRSLKLSQGEVHDFAGEVQTFSGEVQNAGSQHSQGRCALPHTSLQIRPWVWVNIEGYYTIID